MGYIRIVLGGMILLKIKDILEIFECVKDVRNIKM